VLRELRAELRGLLRDAAATHALDASDGEAELEDGLVSWADLQATGLLARLERFREASDSDAEETASVGSDRSDESEFEGRVLQDFPTDVAIMV
jgi:hypothetical protein